eukprot:TRINITY_DN6057_c0_g1_i1.p1 TRINITY_DN6057_c0_g1~~TRINITY_DN6057_c0_g1_i1.p1  ORF type:complete len:533 (+),score=105.43 TRINITY_DN6057_c0_g1_i1:65-1600(+)
MENDEDLTIRDRLDDCYYLLSQLISEGMAAVEIGNVKESVISHEELVLAARLLILRNVSSMPPKVEKFKSFSLDDAQRRIDYFNKHGNTESRSDILQAPQPEPAPQAEAPKQPQDDTDDTESELTPPRAMKKPTVKKPAAKSSKREASTDPEEQLVFEKGCEIVKTPFQSRDVKSLSLPELRGWLQQEKLRMDCGTRIARKILLYHWKNKARDHLKNDIYARVSKSWVDEIGVGVSAIRPVGKDIVVDKVPNFFIHRLGYHYEDGKTLPSFDCPAEDLKWTPREVDEYLRSMQCVDYNDSSEGVMHLSIFGPNSFIGLSQWVNAAIKGKANATFGAGDPDDITYNHKIQTICECAQGEEFTVEYNGAFDKRCLEQITGWREKARQFQKNPSGNDGMNNDLKLSNLPAALKHLEGTYYICGCFNKSPLFRKKGTLNPASVWIAIQDERWTFYTNFQFTNDSIVLVQSKKRSKNCYPHEIDEWTFVEPVANKPKGAKRRKKEDIVIPKFSIIK